MTFLNDLRSISRQLLERSWWNLVRIEMKLIQIRRRRLQVQILCQFQNNKPQIAKNRPNFMDDPKNFRKNFYCLKRFLMVQFEKLLRVKGNLKTFKKISLTRLTELDTYKLEQGRQVQQAWQIHHVKQVQRVEQVEQISPVSQVITQASQVSRVKRFWGWGQVLQGRYSSSTSVEGYRSQKIVRPSVSPLVRYR